MDSRTLSASTLPVAEIFGPTFQGEGRHAGRLCGFLRLGLCNLSCEWCDTPYTWDRERFDLDAECPPMRIDDIAARVAALSCPLMILSGGEPLLHARHEWGPLRVLLQATHDLGVVWHVETNGTIAPPSWLWHFVEHASVSPKVNTIDAAKRRLRPDALSAWAACAHSGVADFKCVVASEDDLDLVDDLVREFAVPRRRVWIMPEGTEPDRLLRLHRLLAPAIIARGYCTTTRLHALLWGDERGR